jgi:acyl homoserine lactone synthase
MQVMALTKSENKMFSDLQKSMFNLRHETFKVRLNWEVKSDGELEIDEFDEMDVHYLIATEDQKRADGSWRLLPTTGEYMLENIFPCLARGEEIPKDLSVWEISRFQLRKNTSTKGRGYMNLTSLQLMQKSYEFAKQHNISRYVFVTSTAVERMLKQLNLTIRRMGDGQSTRIGEVDCVALWMEVDDKLAGVLQ